MIKSLNTNKIVARVDDIKYCIQYTFLITMKYCIQYTFLITMNLKEQSYKLVQNSVQFYTFLFKNYLHKFTYNIVHV